MNPDIMEILKQSYEHLFQCNNNLKVSDLEAEIINLASYIYLKESSEIDFELDYLDHGLIDRIVYGDFDIADQIIDCAAILFPQYYTNTQVFFAKQGIRTNIQHENNYGSFLKSYFISKHNISGNGVYTKFNSPTNSLWRNGVKISDSPTYRDVNFKLDFNTNKFEIIILPYNPKVDGFIIYRNPEIIKCISHDRTREFEFYFSQNDLIEIIMNRIDKGDSVKYHKY